MNVAYFLPLGGSLDALFKTGQLNRFLKGELGKYLTKFEKIYIFDYSDKLVDTGNARIIQICNSSKLHRFFYTLIFPFKHRRILNNCQGIRVSHLTGIIPAMTAKLFYGKAFVYNSAYDYSNFAILQKKYLIAVGMKFLEIASFFFVNGVIFANKKLYQNNKKFWNINAMYIPNGVDTDIFKPPGAETKNNNKKYEILFVGRLEKQKNVINLVKAISLLNDKNIELVIIGSGEEGAAIKSFCRQCRIKCEIIPKVKNEDLVKYYQNCDLFVLPSLAEGSAKVLLEAMACGCVCLVSKIKENLEIVTERVNGFTTGTTPDEMAQKIGSQEIKENLEEIKLNARKTILKGFSLDKIMEREVNFVINSIYDRKN